MASRQAKSNIPGLGDPGINGEDVVTLGGTLVAKALIKSGAKLAVSVLPALFKAEVGVAKGVTKALKFGGDEAVVHFGKHADQIMKVTQVNLHIILKIMLMMPVG